MGKRKYHKDSEHYIRKKIRKLEKKLHNRKSSNTNSTDGNSLSSRNPSPTSWHSEQDYNKEPDINELYESDVENGEPSVVTVAQVHNLNPDTDKATAPEVIDLEDTSIQSIPAPLSSDFLDILGDSKVKEIPYGPKIADEVSKRWSSILVDGLNKDRKKELLTTILIPENFQLLKAPLLNQEIASVMIESSKNRDKRLERAQNHLGVGIAGLTNLMSGLMEGKEVDKRTIIKTLSEVGQVLLDLHFENTINRKMLIVPTLDKKFSSITQEAKRDSYLFGENLGEKIKATKAAEKSGLQIKNTKVIGPQVAVPRKYNTQGNWRGPPRQQGQRAVRQGGNKQRSSIQSSKRQGQAPPTDRGYRGPTTTRSSYRTSRK